MVLTDSEKCHIRKLLSKLSNEDLCSLSVTITSGLSEPSNEEDALNLVLTYGNDAYSILKRRKIKKEIIFQYLKDENVAVDVTKSKQHFISACLKYWGTTDIQINEFEMEVEMENNCDTEEIDSVHLTHDSFFTNNELQSMALSFGNWFYRMLKQGTDSHEFTPNHFWPDCLLRLVAANHNGEEMICASNNDLVYHTIKFLIEIRKLIFNPNLEFEKFKCLMNRHGFVKIGISGILYQSENCIGSFDHLFGLIENPVETEKTWKIKFIDMRIILPGNHSLNLKEVEAASNSCVQYVATAVQSSPPLAIRS